MLLTAKQFARLRLTCSLFTANNWIAWLWEVCLNKHWVCGMHVGQPMHSDKRNTSGIQPRWCRRQAILVGASNRTLACSSASSSGRLRVKCEAQQLGVCA